MFKQKGRGGGQRPFEQCSKKLHFSYMAASLMEHLKKKIHEQYHLFLADCGGGNVRRQDNQV